MTLPLKGSRDLLVSRSPLPRIVQTDEIYAAARPAADTLAAWAAAVAGGSSGGASSAVTLPPPHARAVQCAMFSATLPPAVEALAGGVLRDALRCVCVPAEANRVRSV
jgi:hypothetical protein